MDERVDTIHSFQEWRRLHRIVESLDPQGEPTLVFIYRPPGTENGPPPTIAALPAAFNPLTIAHVELLDAAERAKRPAELILILDKKTIDKELYGASLEDRLLMLKLFAREREKTSVAFSSHGLFIDKARAMKKVFPGGPEPYFIVGYDTLVRLFDPGYYENRDDALDRLFSESRFLVANRGDRGEASINELLSAPRNRKYRGRVEPISISAGAAAVSSTEARELVEREGEFSRLVTRQIESFIRETGLYAAIRGVAQERPETPRSAYDLRCDIMVRLSSANIPEGTDVHVGKMVEAVMRGEDEEAVVGRYLKELRG